MMRKEVWPTLPLQRRGFSYSIWKIGGLLILCSLNSIFVFAQKDFNIWCFGRQAGLDFNSGAPVAVSGVMMSTQEGNSSIADTNGSLLFYTDGVSVWNRNHTIMPHGEMLWGGNSSSQSALIVQKPGSATLYYIFTTAEALGASGFCYSVVDMSSNGGLGDVTTKNVQLFTPCAEKVCATLHANGKDVWVAGHEMGTKNFRAYLLTSTGVNATPVISSVGSAHVATTFDVEGYMKFSPDGKHLALAVRYQYMFELFNFNSANGVVSNPVTIPANGDAYGVEFSSDNTKLYTSDSELDQYNIVADDASAIIASKTRISNDTWALQLGPDQKIYCATFSTGYLNVINSPNLSGAACNYKANAVSLGSGISSLGLPNHLSNLFNTSKQTSTLFNSDTQCVIQNVKVFPNPVSDKLIISFPSQFWNGEVTITDMVGKELAEKINYESDDSRSISTTDFSNGIYILQLNTCSQTINKKFVVLHTN